LSYTRVRHPSLLGARALTTTRRLVHGVTLRRRGETASQASATIVSVAVDVRQPVLRDVDELARINIDTWRAAYAGIVPQTRLGSMDPEAHRLRWIENLTTGRPGVEFRVAEVDGRLAAYAIAGPYRPQEDAEPEVITGLAELYAIYVDPPMQGRGAGSAVHDAVLRVLAAQGNDEAALWVLVDNAASRRWYERRGWRADGALSTWSAGDRQLPELRMRRSLGAASAERQA
jgi:GNAT superfamily N-acetyltransferase